MESIRERLVTRRRLKVSKWNFEKIAPQNQWCIVACCVGIRTP